jgi:carbon-monoxide dehydrogenase medium subunit
VGDFAIAAIAVQVTLDDQGNCKQVGIGLTNAGLTPVKARKAEQFLQGKKPDENNIKEASKLAASEAEPLADFRGSEDYKKDLVRVLTARALRSAVQRAGGK